MGSTRVTAAIRKAHDDASVIDPCTVPDARERTRRVAIGDPQAPFETFVRILDLHGLLGDDGRLKPDVLLVSMGDHFDWGDPVRREEATGSGEQLLAWLCAHPPDQVVMILGNHDLARVGELARFDDAAFAEARAEADRLYFGPASGGDDHARFLGRYPDVPSVEVIARDFAAFRTRQREWVAAAIRARRFRVAYAAAEDFLLLHAGVTTDDLSSAGVSEPDRRSAPAIAAALNAALDRAMAGWNGAPLAIPGLHVPGNATPREGRGIFFQRASHPDCGDPALFEGPPRRRFDPRTLPRGLTQAVGHIRDHKSRSLLREWASGPRQPEGGLRHLRTDGRDVRYAAGTPREPAGADAMVLYTDGGMFHVPPERYELLDLDTRGAAPRC